MVMKKNAMRKNLQQSIVKSIGRYLAIVMIIALGASMFVGLLMTKSDMVATGQKYMEEQNMFDLRLISPYGWDKEHVDKIAQMDGVEDAEGVLYLDAVADHDDQEGAVYRFYEIPERLNQIVLRGGRMPERADECLADGFTATDDIIGTKLQITEENEETTLDAFTTKTFTIVGYVSSPLYMDMNRGNTSIGNGSLASYFYVLPEALDTDYYAEINLVIPGEYDVYTDEFNDAMELAAERIEPMAKELVADRVRDLRTEAMEEYEEGLQEYEDGLKTYEEEKAKALQELDDAYNDLLEAEDLIAENEQLMEYGQVQISIGWKELAKGEKELENGRAQLEEAKRALDEDSDDAIRELEAQLDALNATIAEIEQEIVQVEAEINALEDSQLSETAELDQQIAELGGQIEAATDAIQAGQDALVALKERPGTPQQVIDAAQGAVDDLIAQKADYEAQRQELIAQREEILNSGAGNSEVNAEKEALLAKRDQLLSDRSYNMTKRDAVQTALDNADEAMEAAREGIVAAEAELKNGERQLKEGREQLERAQDNLKDGKKQLEEAKVEVADGWIKYEEGKIEAEEEFAKAEEELEEARLLLEDALDAINSMDEESVYVLDRNSNVGYGSLNSASDIVFGVSKVLPAFFLLVAALVCITTMTRMIDEERTQIGTLKALGYSSGAIISKYLLYAGSGAVVGCGLGVTAGSMAFPSILWEAYKIMLYITPNLVLKFNWLLCFAVVAAYTAVMLFVTWYCCRQALEEEPAELIRPKAPDVGKKIFMEYLPFWNKISFLNKVTIRNIFRYKQRLAMMLVGIGGCTALLLTGFGLRDSIVNVVDFQFENITVYDLTVYFSEAQTEEQQERFVRLTDDCAQNVMFYNQTSAELEHNGRVKDIYLITADSDVEEFINFEVDNVPIPMPGVDEVLLTVGVTENLGIKVGDKITMRNADMEQLELTVSGIYDNHVDNYAVIIPETIENQWGRTPEKQMAMVQVSEGQDVFEASTVIANLSDVQNVTVSQDMADLVGSMMEALDLVVWVIVFCAGLLAVTVLYNLTNININERIREIATIKVLGFNASETAAYVFKENLSLTVIGAGFGLGLGYLLLIFVMSQIKIDMVWFKALIMNQSYVWSVALTLLAACIVNFVFYFKLEKINMAEALKSVE